MIINPIFMMLWFFLQGALAAPTGQTPVQTTSSFPSTSLNIPLGFQLGPGDAMQVDIWTGSDSFSQLIYVAADGSMLIPFTINKRFTVTGLTVLQVRALLEDELRKNYRNPVAQVIQKVIESKKVLLAGEVAHPGLYPVTGDTRLLELVMTSGGYIGDANLAEINISRAITGGQLKANLLDALLGVGNDPNVKLEPGDIVFVPSVATVGNKIFIMLEGRSMQLLQTPEKMNLLETLSKSAISLGQLRLDHILVIRVNHQTSKTEAITVKFDALYKRADLSVNIPLESGDIIFIPKNNLARTQEIIAAVQPIIGFIQNTILLNLVKKSGG